MLRSMKRMVTLALVACGLGGCAAVLGPRTVEVPQAQLQDWIDKQFPLDNRLLKLFEVTVDAPRIELRPDANRIGTSFDVKVSDRLFRNPHRGTLALDYALRFEPADNTVRMSGVRVERFEIDGSPIASRDQLERIGSELARQLLSERVIYVLRPKDVEAIEGRGYVPSEIRVTRTGLAITLSPLPPR